MAESTPETTTPPVDTVAGIGRSILADWVGEQLGRRCEIVGGGVSTAGASRATVIADLVVEGTTTSVVIQADGGADVPGRVDAAGQAELMIRAAGAGVPVPTVVAGGVVDGRGVVITETIHGESLPRRVIALGEPGRLVDQMGAALASLHTLGADPPNGPDGAPIDQLAAIIDIVGVRRPVVAYALAKLRETPPPRRPRCLVHGDFRLGNLMVDATGLRAVLDWELAHSGQPAEDLGWLCARAWRFGGEDRVAGLAPAERLLDAYAAHGGADIEPAELDWWETYASLRWSVICAVQADAHLSGRTRSLELAAVGRRAAEADYDVMLLLHPDRRPTAPKIDEPGDDPEHFEGFVRPTALELLSALSDQLRARKTHADRVAANVADQIAREMAIRASLPETAPAADLIDRIGAGERGEALVDELWWRAEVALAVANPRYRPPDPADSRGPAALS